MAVGWGWRERFAVGIPSPQRWRPLLLAPFATSAIQRGEARGGARPDVAAFEALIQGRERDVFGYLWRVTGDEQVAYDLCQETFLRAWQHFARISAYDEPGAWLFRVATNLALNHLQKRSLPVRALTTLDDADAPVGDDPAHGLAERDHIHRTLLLLHPRQRAALTLREVYGHSSEEIARALGITPAAAKMTLSRAREEFRRCYAREEG